MFCFSARCHSSGLDLMFASLDAAVVYVYLELSKIAHWDLRNGKVFFPTRSQFNCSAYWDICFLRLIANLKLKKSICHLLLYCNQLTRTHAQWTLPHRRFFPVRFARVCVKRTTQWPKYNLLNRLFVWLNFCVRLFTLQTKHCSSLLSLHWVIEAV